MDSHLGISIGIGGKSSAKDREELGSGEDRGSATESDGKVYRAGNGLESECE